MDKGISLLLLVLFWITTATSQEVLDRKKKKFSLPKVTVTQSGPYVGLQKGLYNTLEFGMEGQYKRVRLIKNVTHAAHMGFNYNFFRNVLGYDVGYWFKQGRLNLTYGANFVYRTDFSSTRVGICPVIGYKIWQLHLQTGCHLMTRPAVDFPTNILFVSLRFVLINQRDIKIKKQN